MNDKIQNSTFNKILNKVRDNLRIIIYFFTFFLILFIIFQFYTYYQNQKILNLSIVYDEAKNNVDSEQYFENMLKISNNNNIYGIMSSLEIINDYLDKKKYNEAYSEYINLLENRKTNKLYKSIISLNASYSLLDYSPTEDIKNLLSYLDDNLDSFISYKLEILYLLSIKDNDLDLTKKLYKEISENIKVSGSVKNRVNKINEFQNYN